MQHLVCVCVQKSHFYLRLGVFFGLSGWVAMQPVIQESVSRSLLLVPHLLHVTAKLTHTSTFHPALWAHDTFLQLSCDRWELVMVVIYVQLSPIRCLIFISRVCPVMDYCCSLSRASASQETDASCKHREHSLNFKASSFLLGYFSWCSLQAGESTYSSFSRKHMMH